MAKFLEKIFGDPNVKVLKELRKRAEEINLLEPDIQKLSDQELTLKTDEFKKRLKAGDSLDDIMTEAFAVVRETAKRTLGQRHYDVQLMGGITMHRGIIAEMRTGEGKTLTSTAPVYLNALGGKGVHLVTVNDYLAKRDTVWMGQIYHKLGLSIGCIQHESGYIYDPHYKVEHGSPEEESLDEERDTIGSFKVEMDYLRPVSRKEAYQADITYGTNNEFGFDFLRDNMAPSLDKKVQRGHNFAIIDEIDSILIDEARTPLIISAPDMESSERYRQFAGLVKGLKENEDFNIDEKMKAATLTDEGIRKIEKALGVDNLYVAGGSTLVHHLDQALRAEYLFQKDKDYVIQNGELKIVDEFTGRIMEGRRYSDGLHQALEAKENVEIKRESKTMATITFQNYFRLYEKLAGMTGTAATEEEEFGQIYGLTVTPIPTNKPIARVDLPDRVYASKKGKFISVVEEVRKRHEAGQPILVGTASIEQNELLSMLLKQEGIPHNLLNAKNHEKEAEIIAQAGSLGAVTVATNMAGRGVDIVLGGNPVNEEDRKKILALGGLYVLGTERHESRRIDNQLRGRSGRQGDPGVTQFYVSMDDDLMRIFGSDRIKGIMQKLKIPEDQPIENKMVTNSLQKAQERVEGYHFDTRKRLLQYDDVLNKHREVIYNERDRLLELAESDEVGILRAKILEMIENEVEQVVLFHTGETVKIPGAEAPDKDSKEVEEVISTILPLSDEQKKELHGLVTPLSKDKFKLAEQRDLFIKRVMEIAGGLYDKFEEDVPDVKERKDIEINMLIRATDRLWVEHLTVMRDLRTSIGLRGYGQRDPLVEYKRESVLFFQQLENAIQAEVVYNFFKMAAHIQQAKEALKAAPSLLQRAGLMLSGAAKTMSEKQKQAQVAQGGSGAKAPTQQTHEREFPKVGRNEPCPCGAKKPDGTPKKYKHCHGA